MKRCKLLSRNFVGLLAITIFSLAGILCSAATDKKAEKGEIKLIIRGDDIGSSHTANIACIQSYRQGIMRSTEVMVPCPWEANSSGAKG